MQHLVPCLWALCGAILFGIVVIFVCWLQQLRKSRKKEGE